MNYKLIATDMDGTLLNDQIEVTEHTRDILKEAHDRGIKIVLATGRLYKSANSYAKDLGLKLPIISNNGAAVNDSDGELIYENKLSKEKLDLIIEEAESLGLYYHLYTSEKLYARSINKDFLRSYYGDKDGRINIEVDLYSDLKELFDKKLSIYKILISDEDRTKLEEFRRRVMEIDGLELTSSWYNNIEIMNKGVSKAVGLELLLENYSIESKEIIAVGDNENDIEMIEFAGLGVAMENAAESVKEKADFITRGNQDDGLAYVIEKFIL